MRPAASSTPIHHLPDADNTLIFYIVGDNGASSEGGMSGTVNEIKSLSGMQTTLEDNMKQIDRIGDPTTEPHYPVGWAWAGNCPFQWVKQVPSHFGGSRNPMVVSWPAKIKDVGGTRTQFVHIIDVLPTILQASGLPAPGPSMASIRSPWTASLSCPPSPIPTPSLFARGSTFRS